MVAPLRIWHVDTVRQAAAVDQNVLILAVVPEYIADPGFLEHKTFFISANSLQKIADSLACHVGIGIQQAGNVPFIPVDGITVGKVGEHIEQQHGMECIRIAIANGVNHFHET